MNIISTEEGKILIKDIVHEDIFILEDDFVGFVIGDSDSIRISGVHPFYVLYPGGKIGTICKYEKTELQKSINVNLDTTLTLWDIIITFAKHGYLRYGIKPMALGYIENQLELSTFITS